MTDPRPVFNAPTESDGPCRLCEGCPACDALCLDDHFCRYCPHDTYGQGMG